MKAAPSPWSLAYKKRTYSPNRIKYPLKRVDWDPKGERNPQNRGKSKYVRISWDEATDLVAAEIKRIHQEYGPLAILVQGDGHGECKFVHAPHGCSTLLLDKMGGFTQQVRNPDSWEGWYWGSRHVWGKGLVGMMNPADNIVNDISQNSRHGGGLGWRPGDHALGLPGPVRQPAALLLERDRHQAGLHLPRPQLRGRHPRRQVDPHPPQHRRRPAAGHHLHLDQRGHLRQGVRRDPHGGSSTRSRPTSWARRTACPRRPRVGFAEVRRAGMDHQGACPRLGQEDRHHRPLLRRRHGPRSVLARAGPAGGHPARHAGPGQTGRAPVADRLPGHAPQRPGAGRQYMDMFNNLADFARRRQAAEAAPRHAAGLGQAAHPQDAHRGGHQEGRRSTSGAPAVTRSPPPTSTRSTPTRSRRRRAAPRST